jgi:LysM repeat protein
MIPAPRHPHSPLRAPVLPAARERGGFIIKALIILALAAAVFGGGAYYTYKLFIEPQQSLKSETAFGTPTPPPDMTIPEYNRILQIKNDHDWQNARVAYEHFLETYPASSKADAAKDDLGEINVAIFFASGASPDKDAYVIRAGDTLARIEKKLKVPGDEIMRWNGITDPRHLRVGDTLYISHPDFTLVIDRKTRLVTLYNHARYFKQYHPITWSAPAPRGNPAPVICKVSDIAATRNGVRISPNSRDFDDASHQVQISAPGYSLYTDVAEGGDKMGSGISLSASDMSELSALLTRGVPVTIQ